MNEMKKKPLEVMRATSEDIAAGFKDFRGTIAAFGPLNVRERELCLLAGYTTIRNEGSFRSHCGRAKAAGVTLEEVKHAVLLQFGSNIGISPIVETLQWAEEEYAATK